jgi:hypothetical protein
MTETIVHSLGRSHITKDRPTKIILREREKERKHYLNTNMICIVMEAWMAVPYRLSLWHAETAQLRTIVTPAVGIL